MSPRISILMSNFNKAEYIKSAISSVLGQTYKDWELILFDDGSSDNSVEIIKKNYSDRRIKLYVNNINIGRIKAMRRMVELAAGEILGVVDSDDALAASALAEVIKAYEEDIPPPGLVYTQCYYCDKNLKPVHLGSSAAIPAGRSDIHEHIVHHFRTFRKDAFLKTCGYDDEIITSEDYDIVLKIEERDSLVFIDKPLYYYRILKDSLSHNFKNVRLNRSLTALAKINAYKRRLGTDIPNLNKAEASEVLFFGIINSFLVLELKLTHRFINDLIKIHPFFLFDLYFYQNVVSKIKKIKKLKKEKSFVEI